MKSISRWHTDLDLKLMERIGPVTEGERRSLLEMVNCIVELAITARSQSILALEKQRLQLTDKDLSAGLLMLIDGTDPQMMVSWFRNRIVFSDIQGLNLLRLVVTTTGLEIVAAGWEPQFIREYLYSYLGETVLAEYKSNNHK